MTAAICCDDGNSPSPRCSPEVIDYEAGEAGVATSTVTWSCMTCGAVVHTEERQRRLVPPHRQPRRRPESESSPDRGADRHLSGRSWLDRNTTRERTTR